MAGWYRPPHSGTIPDPSGAGSTVGPELLGHALLPKSGRGGSGTLAGTAGAMATLRDERAFWAHHLHANLLNTIGAAIIQSQVCEAAVRSALPTSVEEVVRLREILRTLEDAARTVASAATRPGGDLVREVRARTDAFTRAHPGITLRLTVRGRGAGVPPRVAAGTVIVLAEALANAARHGDPAAIDVDLSVARGSVLLRVRDDGRGFDTTSLGPGGRGAPRGLGLAIMREWADALGGRLAVSSVPGRGAQVTLHAPAD